MRNVILKTRYILLASFLVLFSCQKNSEDLQMADVSTIGMSAKVTKWLETQKTSNTLRNEKIDALAKNIILKELKLERYKGGEQLLIIPINGALKLRNNKDRHTLNNLVLVIDKSGTISKGNIIQFVPENSGITLLPSNTFSKLFRYEELSLTGIFTVLTLDDWYKYAVKFNKGKLASVSELSKKRGQQNQPTTTTEGENCIDWYLITTVYYEDGTSSTSEEFIGRTCQGSCGFYDPTQQTEDCNGSGGGDGGGGLVDVEYEYAVEKPVPWEVALHSQGLWRVTSIEIVKGKKVASQPQGGHFTDIKHDKSFLDRNSAGVTWVQQSASAHHTVRDIYAEVIGTVTSSLGTPNTLSKKMHGEFQDIGW